MSATMEMSHGRKVEELAVCAPPPRCRRVRLEGGGASFSGASVAHDRAGFLPGFHRESVEASFDSTPPDQPVTEVRHG